MTTVHTEDRAPYETSGTRAHKMKFVSGQDLWGLNGSKVIVWPIPDFETGPVYRVRNMFGHTDYVGQTTIEHSFQAMTDLTMKQAMQAALAGFYLAREGWEDQGQLMYYSERQRRFVIDQLEGDKHMGTTAWVPCKYDDKDDWQIV